VDIPKGIFELYPDPRYQVDSYDITFSLISLQEEGGNRLARHPRLYRDKERLEDTGATSRIWTMTGEFYNGGESGGKYPDDVDKLLEAAGVHKTGTLTVPTVGPVKVRLATYKRLEQSTDRDLAMLTMVWVEDGVDDESATRWQAPQASAVAPGLVADAVNGFDGLGIDMDPFQEITDFCDSLSELAQSPFDYVDTWEARAAKVANAIDRVEASYTTTPLNRVLSDVSTLMTDPLASRPGMLLRKLSGIVSTAATTHRSPTIITRMFDKPLPIFSIAQLVKQDSTALIKLNPGLPLLSIPAGTPVRMYADGTARSY
jgi:prophage DNA circulation protein